MERKKGWLTSGAFAALCGTTKETLRHYKDVGLLLPAHKGDNGYFYYDVEQFYDFYAISIFRQTGTPLEEIRRCLQGQNTAKTLELLREQRVRLEAERQKLEHMDFVLSGALHSLEFESGPDMIPRTAWFEREHLLALPVRELEGLMTPEASEDEALIVVLERCRALCSQYGIQTDFQLGAIHLFYRLDAEFTDAVQQRHAEFLVQILVKYAVDDSLLQQQGLVAFQEGLLRLKAVVLGSGQQFLEVYGLPSHLLFQFLDCPVIGCGDSLIPHAEFCGKSVKAALLQSTRKKDVSLPVTDLTGRLGQHQAVQHQLLHGSCTRPLCLQHLRESTVKAGREFMRPQLRALFQIGDLLPADGCHQIGGKLILQDIVLPLPVVPIPHSGTSISSGFWEIHTGRRSAASGWGTAKRAADFVAKHKIRCIPCDNIE